MIMFWNPLILAGATGYFMMAFADLMDEVTAPPATPAERRRSRFKVIQGGK